MGQNYTQSAKEYSWVFTACCPAGLPLYLVKVLSGRQNTQRAARMANGSLLTGTGFLFLLVGAYPLFRISYISQGQVRLIGPTPRFRGNPSRQASLGQRVQLHFGGRYLGH